MRKVLGLRREQQKTEVVVHVGTGDVLQPVRLEGRGLVYASDDDERGPRDCWHEFFLIEVVNGYRVYVRCHCSSELQDEVVSGFLTEPLEPTEVLRFFPRLAGELLHEGFWTLKNFGLGGSGRGNNGKKGPTCRERKRPVFRCSS